MYDGTKLVAEMAPTFDLDFLYDENDVLYGFVKDKTEKYFYVRDFLQNIIGIIDTNGKLVVKYDCTAYGKVTVSQDTKGLAEINPFLYKGYYFDRESGMYYCHTRYYVPEWCRWLNADHMAFISFDSFNQMNLFSYCGNAPIGFSDSSGQKLSKKGAWILFGVLTAVALVASIATMGASTVVCGVIHSVATGFLIGSQLSIIKQTVGTNGNIKDVDPEESLKAGGISAVIGGTSKLFSTAFGLMAEAAGLQFGYQIGGAIKMSSLFGKIGQVAGGLAGTFIGGTIGNELGSNLVGEFPGIRENAHASGSDIVYENIWDYIKRLINSL